MADDELRSESQKDLADIVFGLGTTAAAFGAGAVSLYRLGAARQYANVFTKAREFTRAAIDEILSYSYNDINAKTLSGIKNNLKDSWKRIDHDINASPIRLEAGKRTLIGALADYSATMRRTPEIVRELYNNELYSEVISNAGNLDSRYTRSFSDFVQNIIAAGENASADAINRYRREFNPENNISLNKLAEDSIAFIEKRRTENPYSSFEDKMLPVIREGIKSNFLDPDNLAKQYGSSLLDKSHKDRLLGDSPITLGELFELRDKVRSSNYQGILPNGDTFRFDLLRNAEELAEQVRREQGDEAAGPGTGQQKQP